MPAVELDSTVTLDSFVSELVLGLGEGAMEGFIVPRGSLLLICLGTPIYKDGFLMTPLQVEVAP